jgi:hypothetical protein
MKICLSTKAHYLQTKRESHIFKGLYERMLHLERYHEEHDKYSAHGREIEGLDEDETVRKESDTDKFQDHLKEQDDKMKSTGGQKQG